jgi:uncharacterized membrane protein YebE (DUF533 family)
MLTVGVLTLLQHNFNFWGEKMMTIHKHFVIAAFLAALTSAQPLFAGTLIDARQQNQQQRIEQGESSGQLTPHEAVRLENQQDRIERAENAAKADGVVTRQERRNLTHRENNASRNIYRKKHNRR